jgi:uncharacterized iron-regulated membrane protein
MRRFLFWPHLIAGVLAGFVIFIMSVTGVLLTYEKQMVAWADRAVNTVSVPPGATRLPIDELLAAAPKASALTLWNRPEAAAQLALPGNKLVYVNPYTGQLIGEGSTGVRSFFRQVILWHRWLGENTPTSKAITGASNLAFLFLLLTGVPMWIQRPIAWFRRGLSPKARDYNWHHVLGIWAAVPLLLIVVTAVFFSYSWATPLLFSLTGEKPAAEVKAPPPGPGPYEPLFRQIDAPQWLTITFRPAAGTFAVEEGSWGRVDLKSTWTIKDQALVRSDRFETLPLARRLRLWVRTVHTGEAGGLLGQTIAGLASAAGAVLVYTGLALSWRRLRAAIAARPKAAAL